jgi:hypothetical protein
MTNPFHIDESTVRRLLSGEIRGEAARRVADHLESSCEVCESVLSDSGSADRLDGTLDAALFFVPPRKGEAGSDREWASIQRQLLPPRRRTWRYAGLGAAAAAALALGATITLMGRPEQGVLDGFKGRESEQSSARLLLSLSVPGPGAPSLERAASGAVVPSEASLLFRVEASGPAQLALLRVGPDGSEVLWEGSATRAGAIDVEVGGHPAAYPLHGLAGRQRFGLLAAPSLDPQTLQAARRVLSGSEAAGAPSPAVSLDVVEVTVR